MKLLEYAKWTDTVAVYPASNTGSQLEFAYLALGLCGEAAELVEKVNYSKQPHEEILAELGDVYWYAARLMHIEGMQSSAAEALNADYSQGFPYRHLIITTGRVGELVKKYIRDSTFRTLAFQKAMLDVFQALANVCGQLSTTPEGIMQMNVTKLESRKARNVLHGAGDNR
ncbi:MAG TPA: MazG nucleotide pyrophosphohydrolase domain-containing protein [Rhodopila sp.]|nr:MazG nucleotide pyrophosphohydrolase domain-containing protein [Rhodopila sp.]